MRADKITLAALADRRVAYLAGDATADPALAHGHAAARRRSATARETRSPTRSAARKVVDTEAVAGGGSLPGLGDPVGRRRGRRRRRRRRPRRGCGSTAWSRGSPTARSSATCAPSIPATTPRWSPRCARRRAATDDVRVVATAGHVDHGKSSLVLALTGTDPDRFPEEKARGPHHRPRASRSPTLPSGTEVGFVDVPGHVRFVKNMLAGVGAVDVALLVVAANEGWMPQSEEHLRILDAARRAPRGRRRSPRPTPSTTTTLELDALDVDEHLDGVVAAGRAGRRVRLGRRARARRPATRPRRRARRRARGATTAVGPGSGSTGSFAAKGAGTVVTGTLTGGAVAVDDDAARRAARPCRVRVRGIESAARGGRARSSPGARVALNLAGVEHHDARRAGTRVVRAGQWLDADRRRRRGHARARSAGPAPARLRAAVGSGEHAARARVARRRPPLRPPPLRRAAARSRPATGSCCATRRARRTVAGAEVLDVESVVPAADAPRGAGPARRRPPARRARVAAARRPGSTGRRRPTRRRRADRATPSTRGDAMRRRRLARRRPTTSTRCAAAPAARSPSITRADALSPGLELGALAATLRRADPSRLRAALDGDGDTLVVDAGRGRDAPEHAATAAATPTPDARSSTRSTPRRSRHRRRPTPALAARARRAKARSSTSTASCSRRALRSARAPRGRAARAGRRRVAHGRRRARRCSARARGSTWSRSSSGSTATGVTRRRGDVPDRRAAGRPRGRRSAVARLEQPAALVLVQPAPDAVRLADAQRVVEALARTGHSRQIALARASRASRSSRALACSTAGRTAPSPGPGTRHACATCRVCWTVTDPLPLQSVSRRGTYSGRLRGRDKTPRVGSGSRLGPSGCGPARGSPGPRPRAARPRAPGPRPPRPCTGSPAWIGVARLVRARQRAPRISTTPSGSTATSAVPSSPIMPSRPTVGVEKRDRIIAVMPPSMNNTVPPITTRNTHHAGRSCDDAAVEEPASR